MRFEERELQPYAEFVSMNTLSEGETYFSVRYVDDDMLIPFVETLVFIGRNLVDDDVGQTYFQDADSYRKGIRRGSASEDQQATFECYQQDQKGRINGIFEFDRALDELMRCALRRQRKGTT
jgi:hypothetical protein